MTRRQVQGVVLAVCLVLLVAALIAPKTHVRTKRVLMLGAAVAGAASTLVGATS